MVTCAPCPEQLIETTLAEIIGPQKFSVWFKHATRFTLTDRHLHICSPNHFVSEHIERKFSGALLEAARQVLDVLVSLSFAIDPSLARKVGKRQPDRQAELAAKTPSPAVLAARQCGGTELGVLKGRFDTFVEGLSNRMAHAAARSVAENPGAASSCLFLHGGCGLGKTHLLQAICNHFRENNAGLVWRYTTGEDFTNDYCFALRNGQMAAFNDRYRGLDVLVIDDVHFLANKKATQEGFLHTFKAIDACGKQVVLASDAHPKLIGSFTESLTSRFLSGMVFAIDPPDFEVRLGVLRQRAEKLKAEVNEDVLRHIAENFRTNIRELEGALLKVVAMGQFTGRPATLAVVDQTVRELARHVTPAVQLSDIENKVSIYFGLRPADLHTSKKSRTIALARGIAMYLTRKHTDMSFPEIGRFMGGKNHSTVLLACRRIARLIEASASVNWGTSSGPRSRNINVILEDIEAQSGLVVNSLNPNPVLGAA